MPKYTPINKESHEALRWSWAQQLTHVAKEAVVPIVGAEVGRVVKSSSQQPARSVS
jgi:hypothetical protein